MSRAPSNQLHRESDKVDKIHEEQQSSKEDQKQHESKHPTISIDSRISPKYPIRYWQDRLVGKKLIGNDAEGDNTVSPE